MKAAGNEDTRGEEMLAAATTLRDSSGRDRKAALRRMANAWGVTLNEKVGGKYKPRPNSALTEDNNDQRHHRQRTPRRIPDQILEHIWRKGRTDTDGG